MGSVWPLGADTLSNALHLPAPFLDALRIRFGPVPSRRRIGLEMEEPRLPIYQAQRQAVDGGRVHARPAVALQLGPHRSSTAIKSTFGRPPLPGAPLARPGP